MIAAALTRVRPDADHALVRQDGLGARIAHCPGQLTETLHSLQLCWTWYSPKEKNFGHSCTPPYRACAWSSFMLWGARAIWGERHRALPTQIPQDLRSSGDTFLETCWSFFFCAHSVLGST